MTAKPLHHANKDLSNAVSLTEADIYLLLGAIISDSVKYDDNINAYARRFDHLQRSTATGKAVPRSKQGSITSYNAAQILTNAAKLQHRSYATRGDALKKLGTHPFNINMNIHNTLDQIAQHGAIQNDTIDRVFPRSHMTEYVRASGGKIGVMYGENFAFDERMKREAEYLLQSLPAFVSKHNTLRLVRENKFDDADIGLVRKQIDNKFVAKSPSLIPFI